AATTISSRTGIRPGGLRTYVQFPEISDPGDASSAVADFDKIHHRHHDRITRGMSVALDPVVRGDLDLSVEDQAAFCCRSSYIKGQQVVLSDQTSKFGSPPKAAGGPRFHHRDRNLACPACRIDTTVRLHDVQLPIEATASQSRGQPPQ